MKSHLEQLAVRRVMVGTDWLETAEQSVLAPGRLVRRALWCRADRRAGGRIAQLGRHLNTEPPNAPQRPRSRRRVRPVTPRSSPGERGRALVIVDDDRAMAIGSRVLPRKRRLTFSWSATWGMAGRKEVHVRQHPQPHQPLGPLHCYHSEDARRSAIAVPAPGRPTTPQRRVRVPPSSTGGPRGRKSEPVRWPGTA